MFALTPQIPTPNHAKLAQITATRCGICSAALTDAESVQLGIGPTCSTRYYSPKHQPTETQVLVALGHLAASGLPDHVVDGFLKLVDNNHVNARLGCNFLVYWISAHYDDKDEVFKCTVIIRALGYTELADKLEADRTTVTVRLFDDRVEAFVPDKYTTDRDLTAIPGSVRLTNADGSPQKQGRKIGWTFPLNQLSHFEAVLGVHHGGELACGTRGIYTIQPRRWADVMVFRQVPVTGADQNQTTTLPQGGVVQIITLPSGRLEIHSPYNTAFKEALKASVPYQQRTWTGSCWVVSPGYMEVLRNLITLHYGVTV